MKDGNREIELNKIKVDYLRLTTYSPELYDYWVESVRELLEAIDNKPVAKECQIMQYKGRRVDVIQTFCGEGKQSIKGMKNEEPHYMVDVAGWFADYLYPYIKAETLKWDGLYRVPRMDVQKTIDLETFFHCFQREPGSLMIDMVNTPEGQWVGRKPVIAYNSDLSIGLGNRKSLMFRRIYRKSIEPYLVRFESEYHNRYGATVFKNGTTNFYTKSWLNMPESIDMARFLGSSEPVQWVKLPSERANKVIWLRDCVFPSLLEEVGTYDLQQNTDFGFGIKKSLEAILAIIDRLDESHGR